MDLLVSLCNRSDDYPEALVLVSPEGQVRPVPLPEPGLGAMGLAYLDDQLLVVVRRGRPETDLPELSELYVLDRGTLTLEARHSFDGGRDVHSLAVRDSRVYAVSTGTDELLELSWGPQGMVETAFWRPEPAAPRADVNHLNSVYVLGGELVVAGFGPKPRLGADWKEACRGFLWNVDRDRRLGPVLYQPHTVLPLADTVAVCESPQRTVLTLDGRRSGALPGYTRGLALWQEQLWVGVSKGRRQSKSTGLIHNLAAPGEPAGECSLCALDPEDLSLVSSLSLEPYGREVYDLLPWPGEI